MSAFVLSIANQKGGVGKTTTTLSLGAALAQLGKRVLVMDLDPHACATIHLSFFPGTFTWSALDIFIQNEVRRVIYKRKSFDFVPSNIRLSDLESDLKDVPGKGLILRNWIKKIGTDYDYVLIDCPPQMGVLLVNALVAADQVIIPIQTDFLALHGLKLIFDTMRLLNKVLKRPIHYRALATMYDRRAGACRRVLKLLRQKMGRRMFSTVINTDTKFREASAKGEVILDYAPKARGALEYMQLAREILGSREDRKMGS
ncbi:ParA family protein [Desulfovulcanus sp.]